MTGGDSVVAALIGGFAGALEAVFVSAGDVTAGGWLLTAKGGVIRAGAADVVCVAVFCGIAVDAAVGNDGFDSVTDFMAGCKSITMDLSLVKSFKVVLESVRKLTVKCPSASILAVKFLARVMSGVRFCARLILADPAKCIVM